MTIPASELFGVHEGLRAALEAAGLHTSDQLLAASAYPRDREALAARLGIDTREVLELANRADLARIKGVGKIYSDLLEWTGVDTVAELAQRNPANLYAAIVKAADLHFARRLPTPENVADWVAEAKTLARMLFHTNPPKATNTPSPPAAPDGPASKDDGGETETDPLALGLTANHNETLARDDA